MDRNELLRRLRARRTQLTQELGQQIHHIEELEVSIRMTKGQDTNIPLFPPQNPSRNVPIRRIDTDTYLFSNRPHDVKEYFNNRLPGRIYTRSCPTRITTTLRPSKEPQRVR
jgi:hypothetical protein